MASIGGMWLKAKNEIRFLLEQKWGIIKPADPYSISKSILKKYLKVSPVIIDCGAHVGMDSMELAKIFPKGKVHSIEPIPHIYDELIRNTNKYSNIKCYQLALSDDNGYSKMYVSSGSSDQSSSLLKPTGWFPIFYLHALYVPQQNHLVILILHINFLSGAESRH